MLDMPGWKGSQLIVKSRIELGFIECSSHSMKTQAFYNEQDASIDANSATAGQENAVIIKLSNSLLSVYILFLLPCRSLHIFINTFFLSRKLILPSVLSLQECKGLPSEHNILISYLTDRDEIGQHEDLSQGWAESPAQSAQQNKTSLPQQTCISCTAACFILSTSTKCFVD